MVKSKLSFIPSNMILVAMAVCPFLAVTSSFTAGFILSLSVFVTLIIAELIAIAAINLIGLKINLFISLVISAFSTTLVQIIVYNIFSSAQIIFGTALSCMAISILAIVSLEDIGSAKSKKAAFFDGFFNGAYVILALILIGFVRELFGKGTIFTKIDGSMGLTIFSSAPLPILSTTAGGLMLSALVIGVIEFIIAKKGSAKADE